MDFAEFRKANRAARIFQAYTSDQRANHAASHRMGHRQKLAAGEFFYTHPLCPGIAFPTRGRAEMAAYQTAQEVARP